VTPEELDAKVVRTRAEQGLPPVIEDPATLERIAAVFRLVTVPAAVSSPRTPRRRKTTVAQVTNP
jgi:hypothetical protein